MLEQMLGLPVRRREDVAADGVPMVVLRHRWPPQFMDPPAGWYVHVQPWEFGAAPQVWIDALRERADAVWCYSTYVRDLYVAGGLDAERVAVVPLGFDPLVYHPGAEPLALSDPDACVFLFVGGLPARKNIGMLVEAYTRAFTAGDRVALVIKDVPGGGAYVHGWREKLRALSERTDIAPVRYVETTFSDADMARLYRAATALVHPYRGEGFGLPVLEAMACGTPVIVTQGGSTDDFVGAAYGFPIPATRVPLGRVVDDFALAGEGWWLEPDLDALVAALRHCYEHRGDARTRGAAAAAHARAGWTWDHAANVLERRAAEVVGRPPLRAAGRADRLADYAGSISSRGGEDGMLFELFARLRVADASFVEVGTASGEAQLSALFAERMAWRSDDSAATLDLLVLGSSAPPGVRASSLRRAHASCPDTSSSPSSR